MQMTYFNGRPIKIVTTVPNYRRCERAEINTFTSTAGLQVVPKIYLDYLADGWTTVKLYHGGKNLVYKVAESTNSSYGVTYKINADGSVTATGTSTGSSSKLYNGGYNAAPYFRAFPWIKNGVTLTIGKGNGSANEMPRLNFVLNDSVVGNVSKYTGANGANTTFTIDKNCTPENTHYGFYLRTSNGSTVNETIYPLIVIGNSLDGVDFDPADVETVALGRTIYGGYIDFKTGKLVSTLDANGAALSTPVEYGIALPTITARGGSNNVWADCGEIETEYQN